jgi:hypothetical protein
VVKPTFRSEDVMSALHPKADMCSATAHVRFRPKADMLEIDCANCQLRYMGVWNADQYYVLGNFVTHAGSLWHCNVQQTMARPGHSKDWQLAVKRGNDARQDARYARHIGHGALAAASGTEDAA